MNEREKLEKVIKGLECCTTQGFGCIDNKKCPYVAQSYCGHCVDSMLRDAIALLKAQEPVEPIVETHWETPSVYDNDLKVTENKCGACGAEIDKWDKYCRVCGQAVKWND